MREAALGLGRPRREDAQSARARMLDAGEPERRLADPGLALEHERRRPCRRSADEGAEGGELLLSADDLDGHRARRRGYVTTILPCIQGCSPHMK